MPIFEPEPHSLYLYVNAPVEHRRIVPPEVGIKHIGYFSFFRPQFEPTLWPLAAQWLTR